MSGLQSTANLDDTEIHKAVRKLIKNLVNLQDTTGKFLLDLPDGRRIDTKSWTGWDWTHGIGLYGLYQYYKVTSSPEILKIIQDWFADNLAKGTSKNVNTMAAFLTLADIYNESKDPEYLPYLESWAEWAMYELPRTTYGGFQHLTYDLENPNELWDDTLMMTAFPLAKIGKVLDRPQYVEESKRQFLLHIHYLHDATTGLFFHGWKFDENAPGGVGHHFARARWARGNSWLTIVIPDFVELLDLPTNDAIRLQLLVILESQVRALKSLQTSEGMWRTLLDVPERDGSYVEASATAGFTYGILKAIRKGYISPDYNSVASEALKAVFNRISDDGELRDVSFGTPVGWELEDYLRIEKTSMPYGQAMAIMASVEFLKIQH